MFILFWNYFLFTLLLNGRLSGVCGWEKYWFKISRIRNLLRILLVKFMNFFSSLCRISSILLFILRLLLCLVFIIECNHCKYWESFTLAKDTFQGVFYLFRTWFLWQAPHPINILLITWLLKCLILLLNYLLNQLSILNELLRICYF